MMESGGMFRANGRRELTQHGLTASKEASSPRPDLWNGGLVCAFEFVRGSSEARPGAACKHHHHGHGGKVEKESYWAPIGWRRIAELVETTVDGGGAQAAWGDGQDQGQMMSLMDGDGGGESARCGDADSVTVADVVAPYWQRPAGPTWWCHVTAGHPGVDAWLAEARWLHPAICVALRDETVLISEKMRHLLYEACSLQTTVEFQVPVRVAGGLLFELLGQSVGDPGNDEDDIPIVLRAWQAQNFLITALHVKGSAPNINVIGVTEVQELLSACRSTAPKCINEVIAHLASRLARWDDRLWRKYVFGVADEIELKFVNRRNQEDLNLLCIIFNQDIRRLATQVIRVKWSLHAREEIIFELLKYLKGSTTKSLLEAIRKDTRQMIEEQEAVRGRLFTIQDVMQSTVRAWLQDRSLRITHNLTIFGGCGLILSIITGLFGINVDGIPGAKNTPYAFALFSGLLFLIGFLLIIAGIIYFGLEKPISDEQVEVRKLELQEIVSMFQHEAQTHAKVREGVLRSDLPPRAADLVYDKVRKLGRYISFHANREPSLQDEEGSC